MINLTLIQPLLQLALLEDIGSGDATSQLLIPPRAAARMALVTRERIVVAGLEAAAHVFALVDETVEALPQAADGDEAQPGEALLVLTGPARALLAAERTALNVLQRMCGVATLTRRYADAIQGTGAILLDTRKTMPGMRLLDKYAVACGGGENHRMGLYDAVMIKDNHIALSGAREAGATLADLVRLARAGTALPVIIECDTLAQVEEALAAAPDRILLDNMPPEQLREAVRLSAGRTPLEASGGISLDTIREVALTGVNYISVGKLTHSVRAADIGADVE